MVDLQRQEKNRRGDETAFRSDQTIYVPPLIFVIKLVAYSCSLSNAKRLCYTHPFFIENFLSNFLLCRTTLLFSSKPTYFSRSGPEKEIARHHPFLSSLSYRLFCFHHYHKKTIVPLSSQKI